MSIRRWTVLAALAAAGYAHGQEMRIDQIAQPLKLTLQQEPSVYALPAPPRHDAGFNQGGINLDITFAYFNNYIYRGVERAAFIAEVTDSEAGNANFQFDGTLSLDLGRLPHPFIGIFTNVLDRDDISNFQEVRPFFGAQWAVRPVIFTVGHNTYVFPDRDELNTSEVYFKLTIDDAAILRRDEPLLRPYIYAAYDYDNYDGWYLEAGVSHDFVIENTGITLTALGNIAYVADHGAFAGPEGDDTGFQHWQVGLIGRYSLNTLLNIPLRYGRWSLNGYVYYTGRIDDGLRADSTLWGGAGIQLKY
jgi:hypothetical protein